MNTYKITWEIELDAESELEAAKLALEIQRDKHSTATIMVVTNEDGNDRVVDAVSGSWIVCDWASNKTW